MPIGANSAVRPSMTCHGICEPASRVRLNENMLIPGSPRIDLNAADDLIHPFAHSPVRIVIEGIHRLVLKRSIGLDPVPALPDGRCTVKHWVKPGGVISPVEQQICCVLIAEAAEHLEQMRRTQEPCREISPGSHVLRELGCGERPQGLRQKIKIERQNIGSLRPFTDVAIAGHEPSVKRLTNMLD